jgi:hypothetical protein
MASTDRRQRRHSCVQRHVHVAVHPPLSRSEKWRQLIPSESHHQSRIYVQLRLLRQQYQVIKAEVAPKPKSHQAHHSTLLPFGIATPFDQRHELLHGRSHSLGQPMPARARYQAACLPRKSCVPVSTAGTPSQEASEGGLSRPGQMFWTAPQQPWTRDRPAELSESLHKESEASVDHGQVERRQF